jgi:Domain of unknown function (DUF4136)
VDLGKRLTSAVLMSGILLGGLVLAGCDDNVEILRDPDVRFNKGMTWAWRPVTPPAPAKKETEGRPVVSRDVITLPPQQHMESNRDWNTEANRKQLQDAIERALSSKGLTKTADPAAADFLVDYHVAVKTQKATVQHVYPGGYPGAVCGPYGCWSGWGWGPPELEYQNVAYHEGTFVIDLALRQPRKLAYRAISRKELSKANISPYQAEEAVNHLLKGLKVQ